jgi:ABC transport system ATP-binding/permease protein
VASARLGRKVVDMKDVTLRVGVGPSERVLLEGLDWQLGPGDRVGLLGPNGVGKTTLLRVLTGGRPAESGSVVVGATVVPAILEQTITAFDPEDRVLPSVERLQREVEIGGRILTASTLLGDFGFKGDKVMTRLGDLSGGELRRLELLKILIGGPNLLVLDEPTNDLDVETLAVIEDVLDSWPGTLVVVSHDRYFLERTCDDLFALLGDGSLRHLPSGVGQYLELRARGPRSRVTTNHGVGSAEQPPGPSHREALTGADAHSGRKELARIEQRLERAGRERVQLQERMLAAQSDHAELSRLAAAEKELSALCQQIESRWLELAELLEG